MIRATYKHLKGQEAVYASGNGGEYSARVITVHRDGSYTIKVLFAARDGKLLNGYYGDNYRVGADQLNVRTQSGTPIGQLRHPC